MVVTDKEHCGWGFWLDVLGKRIIMSSYAYYSNCSSIRAFKFKPLVC